MFELKNYKDIVFQDDTREDKINKYILDNFSLYEDLVFGKRVHILFQKCFSFTAYKNNMHYR